jgi:hypothetical protein
LHPAPWRRSSRRHWHKTGERYSVAVWTAQLLAEFLRFVADDRPYAMWWLIALRGLRRGEAAGRRWIGVDLDDQVIVISQQRIGVLCDDGVGRGGCLHAGAGLTRFNRL